jgi:hypothetical protein
MKLKQLKDIIDVFSPQELLELEVAVKIYGLYATEPRVKIKSAYQGFDWSHGTFMLVPEQELRRKHVKDITRAELLSLRSIVEAVAELEHEQWIHWTRFMLSNLSYENILRWQKQTETPYAELSEKEKESDREWARKVLRLIG